MDPRVAEYRHEILAIAERRGAFDVRVFGSTVRGDATEESDIDFLVRYRPGTSLFDMGGLWTDLHELLGVDIDIADEATLREELRDEVLRQARSDRSSLIASRSTYGPWSARLVSRSSKQLRACPWPTVRLFHLIACLQITIRRDNPEKMDRITNPYTPNAGARPPELAGRDQELEGFEILLNRMQRGRAEQSMIITGLRGVGKTVLLNAFEDRAEAASWVTVSTEIHKQGEFAEKLALLARRALLTLSPRAKWGQRATNAAQVLKSFSITIGAEGVTAGIDLEKLDGQADSGMLADDTTDLFVALGEAARDAERGVVFLIDELQYLTADELGAFIAALHRTVQRALPITLVGAGLPQLPKLAGDARSYAERLFKFPRIGALSPDDARAALAEPAATEGVAFDDDALDELIAYTEGYPYFLQEYGKAAWDIAAGSPITLQDVELARPLVEAELDESFFRVRTDRATGLELKYLRAMASLGPEPQAAKDVAAELGRTSEQLGPTRARLIEKGLLYTPSHGHAAFTVPQFDRYMLRAYPDALDE